MDGKVDQDNILFMILGSVQGISQIISDSNDSLLSSCVLDALFYNSKN